MKYKYLWNQLNSCNAFPVGAREEDTSTANITISVGKGLVLKSTNSWKEFILGNEGWYCHQLK